MAKFAAQGSNGCTRRKTHTQTHTHTHTHTHEFAYIHTSTRTDVHACMHVYIPEDEGWATKGSEDAASGGAPGRMPAAADA